MSQRNHRFAAAGSATITTIIHHLSVGLFQPPPEKAIPPQIQHSTINVLTTLNSIFFIRR